MKLIKLTDENNQTYNDTQWGENVTHTVEWSGNFCASGVIHCYQDLTVALLLNPIHVNFTRPRAWEAEGKVLLSDKGLKFGVKSLTTIREIAPLPEITTEQRIKFGILCALAVYKEPNFIKWANKWLSGEERVAEAAWAAWAAAEAAEAVVEAVAAAARAAARAAEAAARAAEAELDFAGIAKRAIS